MNGVLIVNKPRGWTSHDVVSRVRRTTGEKKVGHAGTLDPLATGVLVLCIGKATRIIRYLESDDKEYDATMRLGIRTDTLDSEGRVVDETISPPPVLDAMLSVLAEFRGTILQRPPAFSAVKIKGIPSYRLARRGDLRVHESRMITIYDLEIISYDYPFVRLRVKCSKGTYIRSLCDDIGNRLGCGAHLASLTRIRSGRFSLDRAVPADMLDDKTALQSLLISMNDALCMLPLFVVSDTDAGRISHGNAVSFSQNEHAGLDGKSVRLLDKKGGFLAVGTVNNGFIKPETVVI